MTLIIINSFQGRFMFSSFVDLDVDILFQKLIAQIGARPGLGTQLCFGDPDDLWVDIVKMQQLTLAIAQSWSAAN